MVIVSFGFDSRRLHHLSHLFTVTYFFALRRLQNVSMTEVDTERLTVTGVESSARLSAVDRTR